MTPTLTTRHPRALSTRIKGEKGRTESIPDDGNRRAMERSIGQDTEEGMRSVLGARMCSHAAKGSRVPLRHDGAGQPYRLVFTVSRSDT